MDFQEFDGRADAGAEMVVKHPGTGQPTDGRILLAGIDSQRWRAAMKGVELNPLQGEVAVAARMAEAVPALLAAVTISWTNIQRGGSDLECTEDNARDLYERHPWLARQVNAFVGNRANIFRPAGSAGGA